LKIMIASCAASPAAVILREFATKLSLSRPAESVDNESLLRLLSV
jgi:hypothetical protein